MMRRIDKYVKEASLWMMAVSLLIAVSSCAKKDPAAPPPASDGTDKVDELVYQFMGKNTIPGATLAIAKDGHLVYAKAYGFADRETAERMDVNTRSRISSISKTITSIAIMRLFEQGKLGLDDRIFGQGGILGDDFGSVRPYKPHIEELTVTHCLSHNLGGWGNASNDPTSLRSDLDAPQLISYIIDNVPLSAAPGTAYSYSNVGYMILGRVIEKITEKTYEQFVQDELLEPIGITDMEIGGNAFLDQKPNESRYHQPTAYTQNFSRRDANGGWIATATDLVKLLVHVDGFPSVPDILQPASIEKMSSLPFDNRTYGFGLNITGSTWFHGGAFSGSRSHFLRTGNGMVAVILVNNNDDNTLDDLLGKIINASVEWPEWVNLATN